MPLKLKVSWKAKGPSASRMAKDWMADPKKILHDQDDMDPNSSPDDSSHPSPDVRVKEMKVKIKAEVPARKRYKAVGE